jgi:HEAT repeat protein
MTSASRAGALLGRISEHASSALAALLGRRCAAAQAVRELRRRDPVRRARGADVLGSLAHHGAADAVDALGKLLHDPDPDVRIAAARALGRIGDRRSVDALLSSLAGSRPAPSQLVSHALTRIGSPATPELIAALARPEEAIRGAATEVLGLIDAVDAASAVEAVLTSDDSVEVRIQAARTLGRLGARTGLAPLLRAAEPAQPTPLRVEAVRALGDLGTAAAATPLAVLLTDPRYQVAHHAARSLLNLGPTGRAVLEEAADSQDDPVAAGHARDALGAAVEAQRRQGADVTPPAEPRRASARQAHGEGRTLAGR